jgi:SRSO17 transposase
LSGFSSSFVNFHDRFSKFFVTQTRSVVIQSFHYLSGLFQANRKNMERMVEAVAESDWQPMQHFISNSPWQHCLVQDQIARDADRLLGGSPDVGFFFDETSIPKKGDKSVGVARQWCGRLGKVENNQTAVFGALSMGPHVTLIAERLYLPKVWTDDKKRCKKAGVPDDVEFKSKSQLALEMIQDARAKRIRFTWVGFDGGYGKEPDFLTALDNAGETFMADVHKDQTIYLEDPAPYLPEKKSKGRTPTRLVAATASMRVDKWAASQPEESWQRIAFRESTKGRLQADFLTMRIWTWNESETKGRLRHLIVRREIGAKEEIKYSLSNAAENTSVDRLAFMQGQRYFVERAFQDAKSNVGLDHYQVRGWQAWHNHMTMVMLAMLYMLETRMANKESHPLLSCPDIVDLLSHFLPRKDVTEEEVLRQMETRHRQRQAAIDFAYAKQRSG